MYNNSEQLDLTKKVLNALSLKYLELYVQDGHFFGEADKDGAVVESNNSLHVEGLHQVLDIIGQLWQLVRNVRDDCQGQVTVQKLDEHPDWRTGWRSWDIVRRLFLPTRKLYPRE